MPACCVRQFQVFPRRRHIKQLQAAIVDNPSVGNYEELGDLLLEDKKYAQARECYDRVIKSRTDSPDPFYRRALAALEMNDYSAAAADLEVVVGRDPKYDYQRAAGLLAHTLGKLGHPDRALALFADVTELSTLIGDAVQLRESARRAGQEGRGAGAGPMASCARS